jgi:hypothetical protein
MNNWRSVLFYTKRHLWLEVTVTMLLASIGLWAIHALNLSLHLRPTPFAVILGVVGAAWLGLWTLLVQHGDRVLKGNTLAEQLTASLATEYANPSPAQVVLGGLTAARKSSSGDLCSVVVGSCGCLTALYACSFREERHPSRWLLVDFPRLVPRSLFCVYSTNLIVPMIAHGLFDMGGMVYFRGFMLRLHNKRV